MATDKAKRSNPLAQPARRRFNPQLKSQWFEILHHLNRGYGIALANLDRLERANSNKGKAGTFPRDCLRNIRNRTEELRALANHKLLQPLAGREERDALRFGRLRAQQEKPATVARRQ